MESRGKERYLQGTGTESPRKRVRLTRQTLLYIAFCILPWVILAVLFPHPNSILSLQHSSPDRLTRSNSISSSKTVSSDLLSDVLYNQGLSHLAFHNAGFKVRLASLVRATGAVAVVGVEYGSEEMALVKAGYEVHGFEALEQYYRNMLKFTHDYPRVHMYHVAAGVRTGKKVEVNYFDKSSVVTHARLEDYLSDTEVDVVAVDIQGDELDVLQGASKVNARSYWIEISACNPKLNALFQLLEEAGYILFDFVPWGYNGKTKKRQRIRSRGLNRPRKHKEYLRWFCATKQKHFRWLQSDIIAVRKDIVTGRFLEQLSTVGNDAFVDYIVEMKEGKRQT